MAQNKIVVHHVKEDADTLIVGTAISMVDKDGVPVIVVAQDTEILVLQLLPSSPRLRQSLSTSWLGQ